MPNTENYNIYGIKDSANVTLLYKGDVNDREGNTLHKKGDIFAYADYATETTNEWSSDQVYAKSKNTNAIRWDYNKNSTLKMSMEIFQFDWIAALAGSEVYNSGNKNILKREVLTAETSASAAKVTMAGDAAVGTLKVYKLNADGLSNEKELVVTTDYTIASKVITAVDSSFAAGDQIAVYYMESKAIKKGFKIDADQFPVNFEMYADTQIRNTNGTDEFVQIHYFNLKPKSQFTITMSAENICTLEVEFDVLKDSASTDMAEYNIYA